jgi:AraC-like DNA-binding protein
MQPPQVKVGLVTAERGVAPRRRDAWYGPFAWQSWVIDWCAHAGYEGTIDSGGARVEFQRPPRSWIVYAPGTAYRHRDHSPPPQDEHMWFFFDLLAPWPLLSGRAFAVVVDGDERLPPHLSAMRELQHHAEPGHELALLGHALAVLGEIAVASQRGGDGSPQRPWRVRAPGRSRDTLLQRLEREALREPRRPPGLAELAQRLGISVSSLCHRFKEETGMGVMERVRWLRVREAQRLLAQPGMTLKDAARRLGFSSPFHLSTAFRRQSGMTAAEFMRQRQRE